MALFFPSACKQQLVHGCPSARVAFLESSFVNKLTGTFQQHTDSRCAFQTPFLNALQNCGSKKTGPCTNGDSSSTFFYTKKLRNSVWLQKSKDNPMLRIIKALKSFCSGSSESVIYYYFFCQFKGFFCVVVLRFCVGCVVYLLVHTGNCGS